MYGSDHRAGSTIHHLKPSTDRHYHHSFLFSGMAPLIRAVLSNLIGQEGADEIEIIANDVKVFPDGKWEIQFRHPTR